MRLRVDFGMNGPRREVNWWQPVEDFPKYFILEGKRWEWFMYDKDKSGQFDYILTYSQLPPYDPNFFIAMDDFDDTFGSRGIKCECGSLHTSFPQFHMFFCPLWRRW